MTEDRGAVELPTGTRLAGRYEIEHVLGSGGSGVVYAARQLDVGRPVVIKTLLPEYVSDDVAKERFQREAAHTANLNHPHIVTIYDFGHEGDIYYLVLERLNGQTLAALLRDGPLVPHRAWNILVQLLEALSAAHAHGIVHRDLKPGNIFICDIHGKQDYVKVFDFGIAKDIEPDAQLKELTQAGVVVGTPGYVAPELILNKQVTPGLDIYAAGILGLEMLSGERAFKGPTQLMVLSAQMADGPVEPPEAIRRLPMYAVLQKMFERDPEIRFKDTVNCLEALRAAAPPAPQPSSAQWQKVELAAPAVGKPRTPELDNSELPTAELSRPAPRALSRRRPKGPQPIYGDGDVDDDDDEELRGIGPWLIGLVVLLSLIVAGFVLYTQVFKTPTPATNASPPIAPKKATAKEDAHRASTSPDVIEESESTVAATVATTDALEVDQEVAEAGLGQDVVVERFRIALMQGTSAWVASVALGMRVIDEEPTELVHWTAKAPRPECTWCALVPAPPFVATRVEATPMQPVSAGDPAFTDCESGALGRCFIGALGAGQTGFYPLSTLGQPPLTAADIAASDLPLGVRTDGKELAVYLSPGTIMASLSVGSGEGLRTLFFVDDRRLARKAAATWRGLEGIDGLPSRLIIRVDLDGDDKPETMLQGFQGDRALTAFLDAKGRPMMTPFEGAFPQLWTARRTGERPALYLLRVPALCESMSVFLAWRFDAVSALFVPLTLDETALDGFFGAVTSGSDGFSGLRTHRDQGSCQAGKAPDSAWAPPAE